MSDANSTLLRSARQIDFRHEFPRNTRRTSAWLAIMSSFFAGFVVLSFLFHGSILIYLAFLLLLIPFWVFPVWLLTLGRRPDYECIIADGYIYWRTRRPQEQSVQLALNRINTVLVDRDQTCHAPLIRLEIDNGEMLDVPELGMRDQLDKFIRAVRSQSPSTRVTNYRQPRQPKATSPPL